MSDETVAITEWLETNIGGTVRSSASDPAVPSALNRVPVSRTS